MRHRSTFPLSRLAVATTLALLLAVAAGGRPPGDARGETPHRPIEADHRGYVSSDTCRSCHPSQYATWHESYHRTMTQVATPDSFLAPLDAGELSIHGERHHLVRRGDEIWVRTEDAKGRTSEARIVLTTGSHHFQVYWLETGRHRKLRLFDFAYQIERQQWIPMDYVVISPPGLRQATPDGGEWNKVCNMCHATGSEPGIRNEDQIFTRVGEFGIACEACHGPGKRHIEANRNPARRFRLHFEDEGDPTIVNPERLSHERATQVCGQCHSVQAPFHSLQDQVHWRQHGFRFRPGDDLHETRKLLHTDGREQRSGFTQFWPDGAPRPNGREYTALLNTACFQQGEMTCLSCHSMHQPPGDARPFAEWTDDQLKPGMRGNQACVQCHGAFESAEALAAHTHHPADSPGSNCYGCHMPPTAYGLHKATTNHQLESPSVATSLATGRPNGCNQCHLDRSLGWTAERLSEWYATPQPELDAEQRTVAAAVLWTLTGDAAQRALMAWSLGWNAAQRASGSEWQAPYLAQLLRDPYAPVRSIAYRSLQGLRGFEDFVYDYTAPAEEREAARRRALGIWGNQDGRRAAERILIGGDGRVQQAEFDRLLERRDDRPIYIAE